MGIGNFLWRIAVKKGLKKLVLLVIAYLTGQQLAPTLVNVGVTLDPGQLELWLTGVSFVGLDTIRNWLKHKVGLKFL